MTSYQSSKGNGFNDCTQPGLASGFLPLGLQFMAHLWGEGKADRDYYAAHVFLLLYVKLLAYVALILWDPWAACICMQPHTHGCPHSVTWHTLSTHCIAPAQKVASEKPLRMNSSAWLEFLQDKRATRQLSPLTPLLTLLPFTAWFWVHSWINWSPPNVLVPRSMRRCLGRLCGWVRGWVLGLLPLRPEKHLFHLFI